MEFHPIADRYPLMEGREFEELKDDIREHGLLEPIWVYQSRIIDGRNRWRACQALGIEPPTREWDGKGDLEAFIDSLNLHRRHLTPEKQAALRRQRIERVAQGRAKGKSTRQLAVEEGVSQKQIRKDLEKSGEYRYSPDNTQPPETPPSQSGVPPRDTSGGNGKIPQCSGTAATGVNPLTPESTPPPKVIGRDGKQYPARKPAETRSEPAAAQPEPEEPEPEEEEESPEEEEAEDQDIPQDAGEGKKHPAQLPKPKPDITNAFERIFYDYCVIVRSVKRRGGLVRLMSHLTDVNRRRGLKSLKEFHQELGAEIAKVERSIS